MRIAPRPRAVLRALLAATGIAGASCAFAGSDHGFYGLVGAGLGYWEDGDDSLNIGIQNSGADSGTVDKTATAYKLGVGYQFKTYNGLELSYHNTGKFKQQLNFGTDTAEVQVKVRRTSLVYVLSMPATANLSFNLRAGVQRWQETWTLDGQFPEKFRGTSATWGVGTKYRIGERTALTLDYQTFHQQDDGLYLDFGEFLAGVQVRF